MNKEIQKLRDDIQRQIRTITEEVHVDASGLQVALDRVERYIHNRMNLIHIEPEKIKLSVGIVKIDYNGSTADTRIEIDGNKNLHVREIVVRLSMEELPIVELEMYANEFVESGLKAKDSE